MAIVKLLHIFAIVLWVGGLFAMGRLLVAAPRASVLLLKKLYFRGHLLLVLIALGCGLALILVNGADWKAPWLHMKLTFVAFLLVCDLLIGREIWQSAKQGKDTRGGVKLFLVCALLFFLAILSAIYILKPRTLETTATLFFSLEKNVLSFNMVDI